MNTPETLSTRPPHNNANAALNASFQSDNNSPNANLFQHKNKQKLHKRIQPILIQKYDINKTSKVSTESITKEINKNLKSLYHSDNDEEEVSESLQSEDEE